jgi:hypothetical protein
LLVLLCGYDEAQLVLRAATGFLCKHPTGQKRGAYGRVELAPPIDRS